MFPYAPQINTKAEELKELGNAAFKDHQYRQAVTHYSSALSYDPQNHVLYSNRSAAYLKLSKFDNAHKDADKCIQLKPDWAKGYYRKAQVLLLTDMPQVAYKYLVVALSYCGNEVERKSITQDLKQSIHNSYSSLLSELPSKFLSKLVEYVDLMKQKLE
ncbi:putative stress-inducible protein [Balamuthia mandrillaris]